MLKALFHILVFPGFLFLFIFGFVVEYADRKLYARLQNRVGPPWFQPFADFIKLVSKEEIIPGRLMRLFSKQRRYSRWPHRLPLFFIYRFIRLKLHFISAGTLS
jgi:hypothetical protein